MKKFRRETFWHFINPVCLAVGIIGMLLVSYLEIGMIGFGAWGVSGLMGLEIEKKDKE